MFKMSKEERLRREALRGNYPDGMRWYGVMTHSGQEKALRGQIEIDLGGPRLGEVLLPELKRAVAPGAHRRATPLLFGGYLFLRCQMTDEIYISTSAYPQVFQILGPGYRIPASIAEEEIEQLKNLLCLVPHPEMITRGNCGQMAEVTEGMMAGLRGRILSVNAQHVKLETSFSFLGPDSGIALTIPKTCIRLLSQPKIQPPALRRFATA